ncbi:oligoendopeptidase F [Aerococcaceae bacterium DSM 109653]|uniref:Oligopeptidase F n=1 Tax=Fundicoccus ignavus TaxID=2664442 RepID=A0A844C395_9LACT|nr:oligoendopeptidase F [Fundicoccus ignavus]MRI81981.1 oligoendopeptidase F [Fundicoccus ignavus]
MTQQLPLRQELPVEETWQLELLFDSQATYEEALGKFKLQLTQFVETYNGKLAEEEVLLASLKDYGDLYQQLYHLSAYASLAYETDKLNETFEINMNQMEDLYEWQAKQLTFYKHQLVELDSAVLEAVSNSEAGAEYKAYLEDLLRKKETFLSQEVEEVLSGLDNSIFNQYRQYLTMKLQDMTFDNFEVEGKTYANSFNGFEGDYEVHPNSEVRKKAWASFHDGLRRFENSAAVNYINYVQTQKKMASLRGFDTTIDYLLFDQKVSNEAYNRQIDIIMSEFAPVMRRYARMLAQEHGVEKVSLADIKMSFSTAEAATISIADSRKMIEEALSVLGEEYSDIVKTAFEERWIDYPMNQTKSTGGFCSTIYNGPSYILLNWTGLMSEVLVLAHELGHAGHFQLTNRNQNILTPEASLYFIEAPSTANEVIMCQYLLNQPISNEQKRILIGEFISRTYFHNMVTHLLEADFQRKVYLAIEKGDVLNASRLNAFFKETLQTFWGEDVEINDGAELTWMRQPHYFIGLYSYTYSAGLTIGTQIGQRIANREEAAIESWLEVLRAGGTLNPIELAAKAGVSMKDGEALRTAISFVDGLLDQMEALK